MIKIMNLLRSKPLREYDIKVDRSSVLGNPFNMIEESQRDCVCDRYESYFKEQLSANPLFQKEIQRLAALYQKHGALNLYCWCFPKRCHAETIRQYILQHQKPRGEFAMTKNNNPHVTTVDERTLISNQIAVYKTDKKLFELVDRLNPAPLNHYATIHAKSVTCANGRKVYSNIGVIILDYSKGKGSSTVRAEATMSPEEAAWIFSRLELGYTDFEFAPDMKIFGNPDENGYSMTRKFYIARKSVGPDGKERNYPWYIAIENGKGKKTFTKTGGAFCQKGTNIVTSKVFVNLKDLDFYKMMKRVVSYITAWELTYGPKIIRDGRTALDAHLAAYAAGRRAV